MKTHFLFLATACWLLSAVQATTLPESGEQEDNIMMDTYSSDSSPMHSHSSDEFEITPFLLEATGLVPGNFYQPPISGIQQGAQLFTQVQYMFFFSVMAILTVGFVASLLYLIYLAFISA